MDIRLTTDADRAAIWRIIEPVIRAGEAYALDRSMIRSDALDYWLGADRETFVAEEEDNILGTYYLRRNQAGGGGHVANCGYMTSASAVGRGVARRMCEHSLDRARALGFKAMQFNFVVASNDRAVRLWTALDFKIVGTLPSAFEHPAQGLVDAYVMHRML